MSRNSHLAGNQVRKRSDIELVTRDETNRGSREIAARSQDWFICVPQLQPGGDWRVARIKSLIDEQNGQVGAALDRLCRELDIGVTAAHLSRLFRLETGLGVREYSKRMRMRAAAHKLTSTALPIKHIAADLGYTSPADFYRQFRNQFKVTPREFRAVQRRGHHRESLAAIPICHPV